MNESNLLDALDMAIERLRTKYPETNPVLTIMLSPGNGSGQVWPMPKQALPKREALPPPKHRHRVGSMLFMRLWNEAQSPLQVAEATGMKLASVIRKAHAMRRSGLMLKLHEPMAEAKREAIPK